MHFNCIIRIKHYLVLEFVFMLRAIRPDIEYILYWSQIILNIYLYAVELYDVILFPLWSTTTAVYIPWPDQLRVSILPSSSAEEATSGYVVSTTTALCTHQGITLVKAHTRAVLEKVTTQSIGWKPQIITLDGNLLVQM